MIKLFRSLIIALLPCLAMAGTHCEDTAKQAASHLDSHDAYRELQELLIHAESSNAPGVPDKLTAEFQVKLSEYHAKLVGSGEFTGSIQELHKQVAKDAREHQRQTEDSEQDIAINKDHIRREEDKELWTSTRIHLASLHKGGHIIGLQLSSVGETLFLYDFNSKKSLASLRNQNRFLYSTDTEFNIPNMASPSSPSHEIIRREGDEWFYKQDGKEYRINTEITSSSIEGRIRQLSHDKRRIFIAGGNTIHVVELEDLNNLKAIPIDHGLDFPEIHGILCMVESLDGNTLYIGGRMGLAAAINLKPWISKKQ